MTRRTNRVLATAGVAALIAAGLTTGSSVSAGSEGGGWTVDTSNCPDPDAVNAPIEGEVFIGSTMPLSNHVAAAAFEPVARGLQAYIDFANEKGLLPDHTLRLEVRDDQYNASLTPGEVNTLLDEGVHLLTGGIGTDQAYAVRDTLNEECVPMLNLLSGDPAWGDEMEDYPWTTGLLTSYALESMAFAEDIAANTPDATTALFYVNSEFGNVYADEYRAAADEAGLEIIAEETLEDGDEAPPQSQLASLASAAPDVIISVPLGVQCISFLNELSNAKAENPGWEPQVYITSTCASPLILALSGESADGLLTAAPMGIVDLADPSTHEDPAAAEYIAVMESKDWADIITTGSAGWNLGEVTVQILIDAAASPDGLTRASIINAARNLNMTPSLTYPGMNYIMNGADDVQYHEDIQIVQFSVADGFSTPIGEPYSFESSPELAGAAGPESTG